MTCTIVAAPIAPFVITWRVIEGYIFLQNYFIPSIFLWSIKKHIFDSVPCDKTAVKMAFNVSEACYTWT
jgi:hypothetical protein